MATYVLSLESYTRIFEGYLKTINHILQTPNTMWPGVSYARVHIVVEQIFIVAGVDLDVCVKQTQTKKLYMVAGGYEITERNPWLYTVVNHPSKTAYP